MYAIQRMAIVDADPDRRRPVNVGQGVDMTASELREALAHSDARNRLLFAGSPVAMIVFDSENLRVVEINAACTGILGYSAEQWLGQPLGFGVEVRQGEALRSLAREQGAHPDSAVHTGRLRWQHNDGHWLESEGTVRRFGAPGCRAQILLLQDASARRRNEEHLRLLAKEHRQQIELTEHYDALTGLPDRAQFSERIRQGFAQANQTGCSIAVCYLDIETNFLLYLVHSANTHITLWNFSF